MRVDRQSRQRRRGALGGARRTESYVDLHPVQDLEEQKVLATGVYGTNVVNNT